MQLSKTGDVFLSSLSFQELVGNVDETRRPETCVHCGTGTDNLIIQTKRGQSKPTFSRCWIQNFLGHFHVDPSLGFHADCQH